EFGARNIRVNAVAPGLIKTPMTDALTDEQKDKIFGQIALKRFGEVSEIASTVSFLLSEEASYITGQTIEISGGLAM
ncbi:MAG: SDR family oxidoreductase, partial [Ruminiclostridium sp.]|nr:SDR family oxidoreductase [Ruminiclostridium sp.]